MPKRKSKLLFEGYLYIMEDYWCLKQADLNFETPIGTVNLYMTYDEVSPSIWLPVSHNFSFDASMMGIRGNGKFSTSMKYTDLQFNQTVLAMLNLPVPGKTEQTVAQPVKPASKKTTKTIKAAEKNQVKIDQLLEKKDLTAHEMNKLSRLLEAGHNETKTDSIKTLEIAESVKVQVDPKAANSDSALWNTMRPIPLAPEEMKSFQKRDSAVLAVQSQPKTVLFDKHKVNFGFITPLLFGKRSTFRDSTWHYIYYGLLNLNRFTFNTVDGFSINQEILLTKSFKPGRSLEFHPGAAYAINRQAWMGRLHVKYNYAPLHRGTFELKGGSYTEDFNDVESAISPFFNSVSSLFFKTNFARFYEDRYLKFSNKVDLFNGFVLTTRFDWKNVRQLQNSTNFSFIGSIKDYTPNHPANDEVSDAQLADQITSKAGIRLEYTPKYYYRIRNGVKYMSHSDFPTIYIGYEKGIKNLFSSSSDFDYFSAGIQYAKDLSQSSSLEWEFHGGVLTKNSQIHFSDFAHMMTQTSPVLPHEYRHSFYVPNYYALSTADRFIGGFVSYKSPFILLKYLPVLSNTLWREMIWAGFYSSPYHPYHTEVGYTILEFFYSTNVGIFVGFDKLNISKVGLNLAFRIAY